VRVREYERQTERVQLDTVDEIDERAWAVHSCYGNTSSAAAS
jgi:hypothetical protein